MRILVLVVLASAIHVGSVESSCDNQPLHCWSTGVDVPQTPPQDPCFHGRVCTCSNTTADCSANFGNLTFVPRLHRNYQVLNFSSNKVLTISSRHFFVNVSRDVRVMDLYNNDLVHIATGVFRGLKKLTTLLLGGSNRLGYKDMQTLLAVPNLLNLSMSCLGLGPIPTDAFQSSNRSKLIYVDFSWNHIGSLNMSVFQPLRTLREISLWHNQIYDLDTAYLPSWETLRMETNRLFLFPRTCSPSGESLFPNLKSLSLDQNMIECIVGSVCLPNLQELSLRYNHFMYFTTDTFSGARFPYLRNLQIMQMENKIFGIEPFFINNSAVTVINFMLNNVDFSQKFVHDDAFGGCVNVKSLTLRDNSFREVSDERFHRLLENMQDSLKSLSLAKTQLTQISPHTFSRLKHVTKLKLYGNSLSAIPDGTFDHLPLRVLSLHDNNIATVSEHAFSPVLRSRYV